MDPLSTEVAAWSKVSLKLHISRSDRDLIDHATAVLGLTRTAFIHRAARRTAQEALLDRTDFRVSPQAYAEFARLLALSAQPNERLRMLMEKPSPWELP